MPPARCAHACRSASAGAASPPLLTPTPAPTAQARAAAGLPPKADGAAPAPQISVRHVPLHLAALDASTFVLPAAGAAAGAAM